MRMTASENESTSDLLSRFLDSGRSEESFGILVKKIGGLIYGSALRRTGSVTLAEEATQNVLVILARKAGSLRNHPSLNSWLYRTASFEAEKILRKEVRHSRRVEEFANEIMRAEEKEKDLSSESLRLLEQSIDRLNEKDRSLLLSRFFEGRKFREIAAEREESEAACKMRLRRVLDQMKVWLGSRGCTLSVAALSSLLMSGWSRGCPLSVALDPGAVLKIAGSRSMAWSSVGSILFMMKMTKNSFLFAAAIILLTAIPFVMSSQDSRERPEAKMDQSKVSDSTQGARKRKIDRSGGVSMSNYPYAHERLEELYEMYPNLRRKEFVESSEPRLADELVAYLKAHQSMAKLPSEMRAQLQGGAAWEEKAVSEFLASKRSAIEKFIELSKLSTAERKMFSRLSDSTAEFFDINAYANLLSLAMVHSLRSGSGGQANVYFQAIQQGRKAIGELDLGPAFVGLSIDRRVYRSLVVLAQDGVELGGIPELLSKNQRIVRFSAGVRGELSAIVSFLEILPTAHNESPGKISRSDLKEFFSNPEGLLDRFTSSGRLNIHLIEEEYAKFFSGLLEAAEEVRITGNWDEWHQANSRFSSNVIELPKLEQGLMNVFGYNLKSIADNLIELERLELQLELQLAATEARVQGQVFEEVSELVPDYISDIPIDPLTREAFLFEAEAGKVLLPAVPK